MATSKSVAPAGTGVEGVLSLLNAFGQQSNTKGTANTAPLENVLQNLQTSPDGTKLLESIFQQASAQIPRLQAAYGNAVGARSGNNSSVQAALNELMKQTTLAGQQQVAQQQQNNQQMQLQAANGIAQATRGQATTTQPNLSLGAKVIAGLQGANQLSSLYDKGKKFFSAAEAAPSVMSNPLFDVGNFSDNVTLPGLNLLAPDAWIGETPQAAMDFGNFFTENAPSFTDLFSSDNAAEIGDTAGSIWDTITGWFGFADGGLVGRDGEEMGESSHNTAAEKAEPHGYADGGVVRSGGGRRSSAPTYTKDKPVPTAANSGLSAPQIPGTLIPTRPVAGGGDQLGSSGYSGSGVLDLTGYPVVEGSAIPRTPNQEVGSGSTATGIPNWLIGAVASIVGMNPLLSLALKEGNKYLTSIDPTNPSSVNAVNGSDSESDNAGKPQLGGSAFGSGGAISRDEQRRQEEDEFGYDPFRDVTTWGNGTDFINSSPGYSSNGANGGGEGGYSFGGSGGGFGGFGGFGGVGGGGGYDLSSVMQHADGGHIQGPGTGTSDSIPAKLSKGEYVVSADVVNHLGADFFDKLQELYHTPVNKGA